MPPAGVVLLATTLAWGSTFVVTKSLLDTAPPLAYLALRFGIAMLVFLPLIAWRGLKWTPRLVADGLVIGLLNATGLLLQVFGQVYTTPAKSAFITSMNTPLTAVFGLLVYRQMPTRAQRYAVGLASIGLCLLTWPPAGSRLNPGDLLTVGCAIVYGAFIVECARRAPRHDAFTLTVAQVGIAATMFIAFAGGTRLAMTRLAVSAWPTIVQLEAHPFPHGNVVVLQMAYMAIVCVVIVMVVQTWALQRLSATTAAVIYSLEPVVATFLAVALYGMSAAPSPRGMTGAFLVLCGIYVAEGRDLRRLMRKPRKPRNSASDAGLDEPGAPT